MELVDGPWECPGITEEVEGCLWELDQVGLDGLGVCPGLRTQTQDGDVGRTRGERDSGKRGDILPVYTRTSFPNHR